MPASPVVEESSGSVVPPKIRKDFPESWIWESFDEERLLYSSKTSLGFLKMWFWVVAVLKDLG